MILQCTKKLLDQLNIKPVSNEDLNNESELLFSWHANLITINRKKTVVAVNDKNRFVVILYGLKTGDFSKLNEYIINAIRIAFEDEFIKKEIIDKFIEGNDQIVFEKTKDKSSVARLNKSCEAVLYASDMIIDGSVYQRVLSRWVNRYLVKSDGGYIHPIEELQQNLENFYSEKIYCLKAVRLKVKLNLENHNVWRSLVIPLNKTFKEFHEIIQDSFGWKDYHLHEFYIYGNENLNSKYSKEEFINQPAYFKEAYDIVVQLVSGEDAFEYKEDDMNMILETDIQLSEYLTKYNKIKYIYDFGDYWQHYIEVEELIENYDKNYPVCIDGEGNTPPEDVGGETGYEEFLSIINDHKNKERDNVLKWGKSQGYTDFDINLVNRRFRRYS